MFNRIPPFWKTFTSGSFFTIWTWLLTMPFGLGALEAYSRPTDPLEVGATFVIFGIVQLFLGMVILTAGWLERLTSSRPIRVLVIVTALVVIAIARPQITIYWTLAFDLPRVESDLLVRVLTNLTVHGIAFLAIATAVMMVSRRRGVLSALARVAEALEVRSTAGRELVAAAEGELSATSTDLLAAFATVERASSPTTRAAALRALAARARQLSHTLALPDVEPTPRAVTARPAALSPAFPGIAVGVFLLAILPYAVLHYPLWQVALMGLVYAVVGGIGETVIYVLARGRHQTLFVILGAVLLAASIVMINTPSGMTMRWSWVLEFTAYASFIVLAAWCTEVAQRLRDEEARLRELVAEYSADEIDGRRRAEAMIDSAVVRLHTDVQGESLRLAMLLDRGMPVDTAGLHQAIGELPEHGGRTLDQARAEVESVIEAWGYALILQCTVESTVWARIADPSTERTVVDALSEAFTNVLKHADRPEAVVELSTEGPGVRVRITSPGTARRGGGRGLRDLQRTCDRVELRSTNGLVTLEVDVVPRAVSVVP